MRFQKPTWLRWEPSLIVGSLIAAMGFVMAMAFVASFRGLSPLETVLFQIIGLVISLGGGLYGSYKFGQRSTADAARDVVRLHARSALRSVLVLYRGLERLYDAIETVKSEGYDKRIDLLQILVYDQMTVTLSAIADWRDVIPEDFEDVGETLGEPDGMRIRDDGS